MNLADKNVLSGEPKRLGSEVCDARHIRALDTLVPAAKTPVTRTDQNRMLRDVLALLEQRRGMLHWPRPGIMSRMVRYKIEKTGVDYDRFFKRKTRR